MYRPNLYAKPEPGSGKGEAASSDKPKASKLVAQYWREIERYKRATSSWHEEGEQIEKLYLEEDRTQTSARRFALLWANIETLKPAVYAKPPVVMCSRRYKDRDPIARIAAELMERATNTTFDLYNVDETFQAVRDDRLLPGRGQAWVRYEADFEQYEDDDAEGDGEDGPANDQPDDDTSQQAEASAPGSDGAEPAMRERLSGERVCTDYVHWTDFGHNVAGVWSDVWLVWRATYKTEDEVSDRFGPEMAAKLTYDAKAPASMGEKSASSMGENAEDFCKIIEVWDKRRKLTSWISEGLTGEFIESGPPPVNLSNFFPCPKPCYATKTSKSLIPRPDYIYYRDQAKEINDLTAKIANMTDWLVVKGFVPGAPSRVSDAIEEVIRDKGNREMFTQVESWTEWTEKGGIAKLIDWMPIDMIIKTLQAAIQARTQLIQDVFQVTGLSDILRGQTDPSETLGAQELKAQTGSRRLRNTKDEVARFCKDVARLNAEIIAEKFEPETIAAITGYRYVPPIGIGHNGGPPMGGNVIPMPGMGQPPAPGMQPPVMVGGNGAMNPAAPDAMVGANPPGAAAAPPRMPPALASPMPPAMPPPGAPQQPMGMNADQQQGPDMVFDDRVMQLLRDDRLRSFRVDVETDSTAQADEQAEKQSRTEFLNATGEYMNKAVQAITAVPETSSLMGEMLMFAVRGFRAGRSLEEDIERTFSQLSAKATAAAQQPPQPNPEQVKAQAAAQATQQKMAQDQQLHEQALQVAQAKAQAEERKAELDLQSAQTKAQSDQALAAAKIKAIEDKARYDLQEHLATMEQLTAQGDLQAQAEISRQNIALIEAEQAREERELTRFTKHLDLLHADRKAQRDEALFQRKHEGEIALAQAKGQDRATGEAARRESTAQSQDFMSKIDGLRSSLPQPQQTAGDSADATVPAEEPAQSDAAAHAAALLSDEEPPAGPATPPAA
jgi:hypothetical protein